MVMALVSAFQAVLPQLLPFLLHALQLPLLDCGHSLAELLFGFYYTCFL